MSSSERTTLDVIAPTVDEAVARGLADLGLSPEDVEVEVLDSGSRGFLGLGGRQVRVRLTVKQPKSPEAPPQTAIPALPRRRATSRRSPKPPEAVSEAVLAPQPSVEDGQDSLELAEKIVREMLEKMKIEAQVSARFGEPGEDGQRPVFVDIHGDDLGIMIGRRAEILNAFQYIVNLIVGKQAGRWVQIIIDVEGYRSRRERQLRQMARQMAEQTIKTGRRQILEPMSAADRRIIHIELRDHPQVTTQSIGEEPARKVTIIPK